MAIMMMFSMFLRRALTLSILLLAHSSFAQVVVIVNSKSPLASMTREQVTAVFLGKSATLPTGQAAAPTDLPESNATRDIFYDKVTGKTAAQVKATWARLTFSGKATPPREVQTIVDVKKYVAANPDAIGYIDKSAIDGTVKIVLTAE